MTAEFGQMLSSYTSPLIDRILPEIQSPILDNVLRNGLDNSISGFALGTLFSFNEEGQTLGGALQEGLVEGGKGLVLGAISGIGTGIKEARTNNLNPWTGAAIPPFTLRNNPYNGMAVTNSDGTTVVIEIPESYVPSPAKNNNGVVYRPSQTKNDVSSIRIMGPTKYAPNGYVVFYNKYGQPYDPTTGKTLGKKNWHFLFSK